MAIYMTPTTMMTMYVKNITLCEVKPHTHINKRGTNIINPQKNMTLL